MNEQFFRKDSCTLRNEDLVKEEQILSDSSLCTLSLDFD